MIKIPYKFKMIKIFPKDFSLRRRLYYSFGIFLSRVRVLDKKTKRLQSDALKAKWKLRKGDIILVGDLETAFSIFINEPLTHSSLYLGNGKVVHAVAEGVCKSKIRDILKNCGTIVILRIPKKLFNRRKIIRNAINYAKEKIGEPYNFKFENKPNRFFCSQLVNGSYASAGYLTGLSSFRRPLGVGEVKRLIMKRSMKVLHPIDLVKGNFELVYLSSNLKVDGRNIILK